MKAINLTCNYRRNPLGIDDRQTILGWKCDEGAKQRFYRILATAEGGAILWDTGKVESSSMRCRYAGETLKSAQRVNWTVKLWDETGEGSDSEAAWFEMGLLSPKDWRAKWICGVDTDRAERLPADCYRKTFRLRGAVKRARLYATACGVYSAVLNGVRLPGVLAPGSTEYEKRLHYQTYDVTGLLAEENTLDVTVGDGWFKGKLGSTNEQYFFGTQLKLLAQLEISYADGTGEWICTDGSWLWCNDGPIRYADLKDGEIYDARMTPSYAFSAQVTDYLTTPSASPAEGVFEHETFTPELLVSPSGAKILDFGQNLAGYIRFTVCGKPGQRIRLRMCEALDHGEYSDATLLHVLPDLPSTKQEIVYTCAGGTETFQPEFFYSGFRYALVEGLEEVAPQDFEAVAVYSELDFCGEFRCSNPTINQFLSNTRWSMKGNFVDVPTDCPQREKSGWTGDAQVFAGTACCFADTAAFYRKWLQDVRDCQRKDGRVDNVCPKIRGEDSQRDALNGAVGWADAAVIIPYVLWKRYGDPAFITDNYDLMHDWARYVMKLAGDKSWRHLPDGHPLKAMVEPYLLPESPYDRYVIESGLHWGEWCEPDVDGGKELVRPKQEITTAYLHYSMTLLAEMLRAVGGTEEAAEYEEYAEGARQAYNYYFVEDGKINAPRQAPMVRALALGLLDEETAVKVAAALNESAIARNYTVGTGFLSTPFVLGVLVKYGHVDTAYKMLENTTPPGWLAMAAHGATTVWETYTAYDNEEHPLKQSMNHYSPGAVCAFLFDTVCGVRVDGENHFRIAPVPGGSLTYAEASCGTPYGTVSSGWKRTEAGTVFTIKIPANTTADVLLPDWTQSRIGWGNHEFCCKLN